MLFRSVLQSLTAIHKFLTQHGATTKVSIERADLQSKEFTIKIRYDNGNKEEFKEFTGIADGPVKLQNAFNDLVLAHNKYADWLKSVEHE